MRTYRLTMSHQRGLWWWCIVEERQGDRDLIVEDATEGHADANDAAHEGFDALATHIALDDARALAAETTEHP